MKKLLTTLILSFLVLFSYAQVKISGFVYDQDKIPLEGASVYINNTSIGTTTDDKGYFELRIKNESYTLVASFIGYETKTYNLNPKNRQKPIQFILSNRNNVLDEVVIKKKLSRSKRNAFLRKFQKEFLGTSTFGKDCKILNPEVLDYEIRAEDETFIVKASEPIKILNPKLGYIVYYDLAYFKRTYISLAYFGYSRYEKIKDSGKLKAKWVNNRLDAYKGSKMHFLKSVIAERVQEEGFVVDHIRRKPNPERPSNKEILDAMEVIKKNTGLQYNPYKSNNTLNNKVAEAQRIIELSKLPEFVDEVIKNNIELLDYGILHEGEVYLQFENFLRITYTEEAPDKHYNTSENSSEYQVSMIKLYNKSAQIDKSGVFKRPFNVFIRGYWVFEKVGDLVPLDYKIPTNQ